MGAVDGEEEEEEEDGSVVVTDGRRSRSRKGR